MHTLGVLALLLTLTTTAFAQQGADPEFKFHLEHPAYTRNYPRVLFDEAHNNFNTTHGSYKPFADLIITDGYQVISGRKQFVRVSLDTFKVLIIVNALGAEDVDDDGADHSAFTDAECDAVKEWVHDGGALLLVADHAPFGSAVENLARRFGVEMSKANTFDAAHATDKDNPHYLVFSRENGLLLDHPITTGRNAEEKISRVMTFDGQSLKGPEGSVTFLKLADSAVDKSSSGPAKEVSAAGRAQGTAFRFGKGRVVVVGDATMLSAQIAGPEHRPVGINSPGVDNQQLALNIMHWLSGLLK